MHAGNRNAAKDDPFYRGVVTNTVGGTIAGLLVAVLLWAVTRSGGKVSPALALLTLLACGAGGVIFALIYQRYAAILARRGPHARAAYDRLRRQLTTGGWAAGIYARRLTAALDAVDRYIGDVGATDGALFSRALGMRAPAPLWTAPAFDRCLLLALIYPLATVFAIWAVSGHVGPAEQALGLPPNWSGWRRVCGFCGLLFAGIAYFRYTRVVGWAGRAWFAAMMICVLGVIGSVARSSGTPPVALLGAFLGGIALIQSGKERVAGFYAYAFPIAAVIGICVTGTYLKFIESRISVFTDSRLVHGVLVTAVTFVAAKYIPDIIDDIHTQAVKKRVEAYFFVLLSICCAVLCLLLTAGAANINDWPSAGSVILFVGLLTIINAPFDWVSLGLTRALLRRGLELGGWWPYLLAMVDAVLAAGIVALLTIVSVVGIQSFDTLAAFKGGDHARILSLDKLLNGIGQFPAAPEYWWVYAMLVSTLFPSLANLTISGVSLLRGIPWITALLVRNLPDHSPPPVFERAWLTLLLTLQDFLGGLLGVAAQGIFAYFVIGLVLPWFGLDLLELARSVAAADLPGQAMAWALGTTRL